MVQTFKHVLLPNQEADDIETWYKASSTSIQVLSNDDSGLTLSIFLLYGQICSLMLLQGSKLIQHIVIYFQASHPMALRRAMQDQWSSGFN